MNRLQPVLFLLAVAAFCATVSAQGRQASMDAFTKWQQAAVSKAGTSTVSFRGLGAAVERTGSGVEVYLTLGGSADITNAGPLTFTAQLVNVAGSQVLEIGKSSSIHSPAIEREAGATSIVIATPRMTIMDSQAANAVRITIQGLANSHDGISTMIVPLGAGLKTAALGTVGPPQ